MNKKHKRKSEDQGSCTRSLLTSFLLEVDRLLNVWVAGKVLVHTNSFIVTVVTAIRNNNRWSSEALAPTNEVPASGDDREAREDDRGVI